MATRREPSPVAAEPAAPSGPKAGAAAPRKGASRSRAGPSPAATAVAGSPEPRAADRDEPPPASVAGPAATTPAAVSTAPQGRPPASRPPPASPPETPRPKHKLVRDSFTMPHADFALIQLLKERALEVHRPAKKSELLRAGLHALAAFDAARLEQALDKLQPLKAGRPKKLV